jgi:hypothetical protein
MLLPELEIKCWKCWGQGVLPVEDHGEMTECPECAGIGWIPTDEGRRLIDFLQRHLVLEAEGESDQDGSI